MASASLPGRRLHLRALCNALSAARKDIAWVVKQLDELRDEEWPQIGDLVAERFSGGAMRLEGALDGLVMLDQVESAACEGEVALSALSIMLQLMEVQPMLHCAGE